MKSIIKKNHLSHAVNITLVVCLMLAAGCTKFMKSDSIEVVQQDRVLKLSQTLKQREAELETLRIENMALQRKLKTRTGADLVEVAKQTKETVRKFKSEKSFYAYVIQVYRQKELLRLTVAVEEFVQKYPLSIHADNALFLLGQAQIQGNQVGDAIKTFDRVVRSYPQGDKRVAALFGKGVAYKKLKLFGQAVSVFKSIENDYPGSREFYRSSLEIKAIDSQMKDAMGI